MCLVKVLMSTYNGEKYLREQIDSILEQELVTVKLLVRDDGSSETISYKYTQVNNHPPILKMNDIDKIESQGCFFARKFDKDIDSDIIDYFSDKIKRYYTLEDN